MHKIFQEALNQKITTYMAEHHSDFKVRKTMPKGAGKSILFQKKYKSGFVKYIQVKFQRDRNYVFLNMQWSKLNRFPDELCIDPDYANQTVKEHANMLDYDEAWLSLYDLGEDAVFKLSVYYPDITFAKKLYTPERYIELEEFGFGEDLEPSFEKFAEKVYFHGWELLIMCYGKDLLDQEDIDRILGDMPDRICQMITTKVIPYFDELDERLGITE